MLYVVEGDSLDGGTSLALYDRVNWRAQRRIKDVSQVRYDAASGRVLYSRLDASGLWSAGPSLDSGSIVRLSASVPSRWRYRSWSLTPEGGIAYLDATPGCRSRVRHHVITRNRLQATGEACVDPAVHGATNGFSGAEDAWYIALASEDDSDIGFTAAPTSDAEGGRFAKWLIALVKNSS